MAEYLNLFIVAGVASLLFFGGWMPLHIPGWDAFNHVMDFIPSIVWFLIKAIALSFVIIWFKWTFPRLRIDHCIDKNTTGTSIKPIIPTAAENFARLSLSSINCLSII